MHRPVRSPVRASAHVLAAHRRTEEPGARDTKCLKGACPNLFTPSLPHFRPWMPRGWGGCLLHTTSRTEEHKAFIYVQVLPFRMKVILVLSIINKNNNNRLVTLAEHHRASAITFSLILSWITKSNSANRSIHLAWRLGSRWG